MNKRRVILFWTFLVLSVSFVIVIAAPTVTFLDQTPPNITFTGLIPTDASVINEDSVYVNLSTQDSSDHYSFVDHDRDVLLWMTFDEVNASGDPFDNSTYGNHGSVSGNANQTTDAIFGKAFDFSSEGEDNINISNTGSLVTDEFTISFWVNVSETSIGHDLILGKGTAFQDLGCALADGDTGYAFRVTDAAHGLFLICDGTTSQNVTFIDMANEWHHIVAVVNTTNAIGYMDGLSSGSLTVAGGTATANHLHIGTPRLNTVSPGQVDELIIFNRTLTVAEISSLYNASANQYSRNFTSLPDGAHGFTGYAVDMPGNKNKTRPRIVTIDVITVPTTTNGG